MSAAAVLDRAVSSAEHGARARVQQLLAESRGLEPRARLRRLDLELRAQLAERALLESFSISLGTGSPFDLNTEDPRSDDGEAWDEVGLGGTTFGNPRMRSEADLQVARDTGRWLALENGFAIGAQEIRVAYAVGDGFGWRAVVRERDGENVALTRSVNGVIEEASEAIDLPEIEREALWRRDRDGEAIVRLFPGRDLVEARFVEPEAVKTPTALASDPRVRFGVESAADDAADVVALHLAGPDGEPRRVRVWAPDGLRHVVHSRANVDSASPRGWPIMWPIRRNLARAEKLLRNMAVVAAIQAAIALIRKHESATEAQITSFLDRKRDLLKTDRSTNKQTRYSAMRAGTVLDAPNGVTYEAPATSVNAANNVAVFAADLRECAARLGMPEYMFSGDASNSNYGSTLVAEAPAVKTFQLLQARLERIGRAILGTVLLHAEQIGRLPRGSTAGYRLRARRPSVIVRDQLQEAQRHQIMRGERVVSVATWREREGLDGETEDQRIAAEAAGATPPPTEQRGAKPPPGSTPGGPGGADMRGNPDDPATAPGERF